MDKLPRIKILKASKQAIHQYRHDVRRNLNEDYWTIRKKLTRNFLLGKVFKEDDRFRLVKYGNLIIKVDKVYDMVVNLTNYKGQECEFNVSEQDKEQLEYILGLR